MDPTWMRDTRGNLVWHTVVLLTVFLPLASLTVDIPEYFKAAAHLEQVLAASAQDATNTCLQLEQYSLTGHAALDAACLARVAQQRFALATAGLRAMRHQPVLVSVTCTDSCRTATLRGTVTLHVFFASSPVLVIAREVSSRTRMISG